MSPARLRLLGIVFCLIAALIAVLNLKRTADLGMKSLPPLLLIAGAVLLLRSRRVGNR